MKQHLEKKIAQYREEKGKQGDLEKMISEKRKNLERLMAGGEETEVLKENDFRVENYARQIDLKHRKYL